MFLIVSAELASCESDPPSCNDADNVSYTTISTLETTAAEAEFAYIINVSTGKFHYPDCPSVKQMNENNKRKYVGDRENLISHGYEPCKRCEP